MIKKWFLLVSESRRVLYSICQEDEPFTHSTLIHMLIDGLLCARCVLSAGDKNSCLYGQDTDSKQTIKPKYGCKDSLVYNLGSCYHEVSVE